MRETVPDSVFERADDDAADRSPPDELLERLKEGKVYRARAGRQRARQNFFRTAT